MKTCIRSLTALAEGNGTHKGDFVVPAGTIPPTRQVCARHAARYSARSMAGSSRFTATSPFLFCWGSLGCP
jgi:hypothetical protein